MADPGSPPVSVERALVLGGGGSTGNAWLIGVVAGLAADGVDPLDAELIIGTSAGATAAAQLTAADPAELFAEVCVDPPAFPRGRPAKPPSAEVADALSATGAIIADSRDAADMRRRMGARSLALAADSRTASTRWREIVAARLPKPDWPETRMLITAMNARTGDPAVFDRLSGVPLVDAVAASCSSGAAYPIGGEAYTDGGYRSNADNADLAAGSARVLVLSPFSGRTRTPEEWGLHLAAQVDELWRGGSRVETVFPPPEVDHLFGMNAMNPALRPAAARAGYAQGRALADALAGFWN
nr:patatin-like phospholipase family protein [Leucobacter chironomi]